MMKLVECIPNFSVSRERDEAAFNALVDTAKAVPGCTVLDVQSDGTHNRCVFTLVGSPEGIGEAAFRLAKRAMEVIDLTKHQGAHPRMGATDVIPFVPTMGMTVQECVELSKQVAGRIWDELRIPSFLYEDSATSPDRVNLAKIRKGQFEGMPEDYSIPSHLLLKLTLHPPPEQFQVPVYPYNTPGCTFPTQHRSRLSEE